ncbi:MAG: hypothetical protein JO168_05355 [Solirubrobacterales bacterium]|nr:hypothetical protein [Solirubrobacterales bacterium]
MTQPPTMPPPFASEPMSSLGEMRARHRRIRAICGQQSRDIDMRRAARDTRERNRLMNTAWRGQNR